MSDPSTYYYNWAEQVHYDTKKYMRNAKPIERTSYTCAKCQTEYIDVLSTGKTCYYCHQTYGKCCKGRYGTCTQCWEPLSVSEKNAQKKRYQKIVVKGIAAAGMVIPFIFFGIVGSILLTKFGSAVGLPVLLGGELGTVVIITIVLIKKTVDVEAQRKRRRAQRQKINFKSMKPYEKFAIYTLFGLLAVIIIAPIIILLTL